MSSAALERPADRSGPPPGSQAGLIEINGLTKAFGNFKAVDDLTFSVQPGRITGFLGPNGAGKTTTLRMLLGLIRPTAGSATIGGKRYADFPRPLQMVGSALEATNFHPGRTGRDHLRVLAAADGIPDSRVDELLELVGIPAAARKRAGAYSMGMRQRLGLAAALLGNPQVLVLDEPTNGLDPEGINWLRGFLKKLARQDGKTVLISSHLLGEVEATVDDVVIVNNGRLVRQGTISDMRGEPTVFVRTPDPRRLVSALESAGLQWRDAEGGMQVRTHSSEQVGDLALRAGVAVHELRAEQADLEKMFLELTAHQNRNLGDGSGAVAPQGQPMRTEGDR